MSSSLPMLLVMLFVHVGKRSNNHSQMFFQIGTLKNNEKYNEHVLYNEAVRKNFVIFTPVFESLFNRVARRKTCIFIKKKD